MKTAHRGGPLQQSTKRLLLLFRVFGWGCSRCFSFSFRSHNRHQHGVVLAVD
ncbi:MAG: hypothetical protein RLZ00_257, partial [Pseudomonadota bacterium]